jgi:hypothetical protein
VRRTPHRLGAGLLRREQPHAGGRVYVNFLGDEDGNRVRQAYGAGNYERLVELKRA